MKHLKYFMMSLMALLILGAGSAFAAAADKDEIDYGVLELNKTYNMKDSYYYHGTFTPTEDGYLHVYSTGTSSICAFKEWLGTAKATMASSENTFVRLQIRLKDNFCYNYELPVKKGVTYYMCGNTKVGDNINVTLKMEPKTIEYLGASVKEGDKVSPTGGSTVSFSFNRPVVATSAAIVYGDNQETSVSPRSSSYACTVSTDVKDAFIKLANAGSIKTGDEVTIVLKGVKEDPDDVQEGDEPIVYGDVSIKVTVGDMPAMLLNATMDGVPVNANTKFMTYYAPGTGVLVLNYSKELSDDTASAQLTFGDFDEADNGGYYKEEDGDEGCFTMKVEGKQVILDFSGKRRTVNDMVTSTESKRGVDFSVINLTISNLRDASGVRVNSNGSTTTGRYNATFSLDVPTANVASEFTPANGASIKNVNNIEIWIQDEQSLSYQGVSFSYNKQENGIEVKADDDELVDVVEEIVVSKDQITRENDPDDEGSVILTVPVPADVKDKKNVTVALYKVTCVDGKDYSKIVAAEYNPADATGISNISLDENKAVKVYNLNGQLVSEGKSFGGLKGVYIVNGKKVVLK